MMNPTKPHSSFSSGILLIDKPAGVTSTAVLNRAKRLLGIRKAGHTGTLDPFATGLLIFCFGEATKISGYLLDDDKAYEAEVKMGETTETGDPEGQVTARSEVPAISAVDLEHAFRKFTGEIKQTPPMHSALKHQGKRLYELAREGKTVERKARRVTIHRIELKTLALPRFTLSVNCSKGTYIRTLAADIGEHLGYGAHLTALRRTASGPFDLARAVTMDALEAMNRDQRLVLLLPIESAFPDWHAINLDEVQSQKFRQGQKLPTTHPLRHGEGGGRARASRGDAASASPRTSPELALVYQANHLLGIGEIDTPQVLKPKRLFNL